MECLSDILWPKPKAKVCYIEGSVGVGKSETMLELAELLREHGNTVACLPQKEEEWAHKGFLADMSTDQGRQLFAAYALLQDHADRAKFIATQSAAFDVVLVERHPSTVVEVFDSSEVVNKLFTAVDAISGLLTNPLHTIFLKNTAAVCHARTLRRGRVEDKPLLKVVFQDLDHKHEEMMTKRKAMGGNVYVSDALGADSHHHLIASIAASIGFDTKLSPPM